VLDEDVETENDQTLLKKLFKTAQIWEFLREFHRSQFDGIKELFAMIDDGKCNWDSDPHKDAITKLLSDFERIGYEISQGLVKESSNLIERVCKINPNSPNTEYPSSGRLQRDTLTKSYQSDSQYLVH